MGSTLSSLDQETFIEVVTCFKKMKEDSEKGYTVSRCKNQTEDFVKVFTALGYEVGEEHVKWENPQEATHFSANSTIYIDFAKKLHETSFSPSVRAKVFAEVVQECKEDMKKDYLFKVDMAKAHMVSVQVPFCSTRRLTPSEEKDFQEYFKLLNPKKREIDDLSFRMSAGFEMTDYMLYIESIRFSDRDLRWL